MGGLAARALGTGLGRRGTLGPNRSHRPAVAALFPNNAGVSSLVQTGYATGPYRLAGEVFPRNNPLVQTAGATASPDRGNRPLTCFAAIG